MAIMAWFWDGRPQAEHHSTNWTGSGKIHPARGRHARMHATPPPPLVAPAERWTSPPWHAHPHLARQHPHGVPDGAAAPECKEHACSNVGVGHRQACWKASTGLLLLLLLRMHACMHKGRPACGPRMHHTRLLKRSSDTVSWAVGRPRQREPRVARPYQGDSSHALALHGIRKRGI